MGGVIDKAQDFVADQFKELTGAKAAEDAAKQQARYLEQSKSELREMTEEAKADLLDRMLPALSDYRRNIQSAQDQIARGTSDVMSILRDTYDDADMILSQGGADAQRAIMGSSASIQGIPTSQFNQMYSTIQSAPPSARSAMMDNLSKISGMPTSSSTYSTQAAAPFTPPSTSPIGGSGTGFYGSALDLMQGNATAQNSLSYGTNLGRQDVSDYTDQALSQLDATKESSLSYYQPYSEAGQAALEKEAALSGAYGPEAQQQAIDDYIESPGQKYLREQQERSLLRNQAAIGGLGGANVRTALQEQAMGIASTQQQQYLENLRSLAMRGQEVAGVQSAVSNQSGVAGANLMANAGGTLAQLAQQYGLSSADLTRMSSTNLANLANQTGLTLSSLQQGTSQARAGLATNVGSSLANAKAASVGDISGLQSQLATNSLTANQNLSNMMAGLTTQTGTNLSELTAQQGSALATGTYLSGQAVPQTIATAGQLALLGKLIF